MKKESLNKVTAFAKKHAVLLTLILVIALQFIPNGDGTFPWGGISMRMESQELPITENWAAKTINDGIKSQITTSVNQQYPNLPDTNKQKLINDKLEEFKVENKEEIEKQKSAIREQILDHFRYESDGNVFTYMPDIDTYYYLRHARNLVEKGHIYDELKNGQPWNNHMNAPLGGVFDNKWHGYTLAYIYKGAKIFNPSITLMEAGNYFPIIFILLSFIPAFFIGRRLAGNIGGFFSVTMVAILPAIMARTPYGHADTDAYAVFFPLMAIWLTIELIRAKSWKSQALYAGLTGITLGLYSRLWNGWHITFYFILFALVAYLAAIFVNNLMAKEKSKSVDLINTLKKAGLYILGSAAFIILFNGMKGINLLLQSTTKIFRITTLKEAAKHTLWPNVYTTVAELNPGSFKAVVSAVGGKIFFFIALLGIFLLIYQNSKRKWSYGAGFLVWFFLTIWTNNIWIFMAGLALMGLSVILERGDYSKTFGAVLMLFWIGGTVYASMKGIRFTLLAGPAFALAFGCAIGILAKLISEWGYRSFKIGKIVSLSVFIVLVGLLLMAPVGGSSIVQDSHKRASSDVPLVNDAWWEVLTKVKEESQPDAIVNSWWDFGHHFKYISDRAVTFDGGSQNSPIAHWVGRSLQTDNEDETVGILRMLDCGSNTAYENTLEQTDDIHKSLRILKEIILLDKDDARSVIEGEGLNADDILPYTHCDPPENYYITSADMTGKAGVWAHFGLWDFEKADIWRNYRKLSKDDAVEKMMSEFNYTEKKAEDLYEEVSALSSDQEANTWISPWPSFQGNPVNCKVSKEGMATCRNIMVNLTDMTAEIIIRNQKGTAHSVVVPSPNGFEEVVQKKSNIPLSVLLVPNNGKFTAQLVDPLLAKSMYTRLFYLDGHGTKYFEKFAQANQLAQGKIVVWKIDWTGSQNNTLSAYEEKEEVSAGDSVKVNYIGYFPNGTVFDASLPNWKASNLTSVDPFTDDFKTLSFVAGKGQMIKGFDEAVIGMKKGEAKTIEVPPEKAYGTDPEKHKLGNKTLKFKLRVVEIS